MSGFGAVFGRKGDGGFSGPLLGACSGVVGFNVAMFLRAVRDICRPARPDVGASAKKFALRAHNGQKLVFDGALGKYFRGNAAEEAVPGEFVVPCAWPGSRARLLAVLTRSCAAKPYWWHGGQPAQATTSRVNVRVSGPAPPPHGLTCASKGPACAGCVHRNRRGPEGLAGVPTLPMSPRRRRRRNPEGSRLSLRAVTAPSALKSHPTSNT